MSVWYHGASMRRAEEVSRIGFPRDYRPTTGNYGHGLYLTDSKKTANTYGDRTKESGREGAVLTLSVTPRNTLLTKGVNFTPTLETMGWDGKQEISEFVASRGYDSVEIAFMREKWLILFDASMATYVSHGPSVERRQFASSRTAGWTPFVPPAHLKITSGGDAVPGGYNGYFVAWTLAGDKAGYLDYQSGTYDGTEQVTIAMVEVEPAFRRQGVASVLLDALRHDFPGAEIDPGMTTSDGTAWWAKVGAKTAATATMGEMDVSRRMPNQRCVALMIDAFGTTVPLAWLVWDKRTKTLDGVWVNEQYRGKGYAAALLKMANEEDGPIVDSGEYTPEGLAWAKSRGMNPKLVERTTAADMARMTGMMTEMLMGASPIDKG